MHRLLTETLRLYLFAVFVPFALSGCLVSGTDEETENSGSAPRSANGAPTIAGSPPRVVRVGANYSFAPQASDPDADSLTFSINNRPGWLTFDSNNGRVSGAPAFGDEGTYNGIVIAASDGTDSTALPAFSITVEPNTAPNMPPEISGSAPAIATVGSQYSFAPVGFDPDGDPLVYSITNVPSWATFNTSNGRLTGTPGANDVGDFSGIAISVTDGMASASLAAFTVSVQPEIAAPTISGTPQTGVVAGTAYSFTPTATDSDGDTLSFSVQNLPVWASFDTATGALTGTPQAVHIGDHRDIVISVGDGVASSSLPAFTITVVDSNDAPQISGSPPATVESGQPYSFVPTATDPDGDTLSFSIQNRPSWAQFDTGSGALTGTPQAGDVGRFADIRISVSDGILSAALAPFAIDVAAGNRAPQISGTPATSVVAGQPYAFTPIANDADGDTLTFSIQGSPPWAQFDTATGALSGTPQAGDVGNYADIRISVSDGVLSSALTPFSIAVTQVANGSTTLSWTPPTQNVDGTPLTDLAGYRIYYGTTLGSYNNQLVIDNPGVTSVVVENLTPGTWYFVSTSVDSEGVESTFSNPLSQTIN